MPSLIDDVDKRILFELGKNARIPETRLAKLIGKSKESVRYRIKKLIDENIILGFTTWIDPTKLGFQTAKMYLTLANIPQRKNDFIEFVKKDKRLFWLGIAEGAWNAGLTFFVKSNDEFFKIKNELLSRFKDIILESKTGSVVSVNYHDKTFLHEQHTQWGCMFEKIENETIDVISQKVLKALFKNSRENMASIAYDNNTSVEVVRNRMQKLESRGIIKKYTISINYEKLGYEFYKTFLYFKNLNDTQLEKLMDYSLNNTYIIHLIKQISPWDIELEIMCEHFNQYNKVISELTEEFPGNIQKVETAIMTQDHIFPAKQMIFE